MPGRGSLLSQQMMATRRCTAQYDGLCVTLQFEPMILRLRHAFGTSHSSTTSRTNALFTCSVATPEGGHGRKYEATGYGESGLPPKKPKCYLADVVDCSDFFDAFSAALKLFSGFDTASDPFVAVRQASHAAGCPDELFCVTHCETHAALNNLFNGLFAVLDTVSVEPRFRAPKSGLEAALLDAWSRAHRLPFASFCGIPNHRITGTDDDHSVPTRSFYTAAMNESLAEMCESAAFGLQFTPAIKIKLDARADFALASTHAISCEMEQHGVSKRQMAISLDANAAWETPEIACSMWNSFQGHAWESSQVPNWLYMVEQPFPLSYTPGESADADAAWQKLRAAMKDGVGADSGIKKPVYLYADESIATADDVERFADVVDGVNIKLEKAGGIRAALVAVFTARRLGLRVWIGTMVCTALGCAQAAQVAMFADDSDVDGGLLVYPDTFDGGFTWKHATGGILLPVDGTTGSHGFGCHRVSS